jgi:CubicO group peptidase (beta-lactamase class C family)
MTSSLPPDLGSQIDALLARHIEANAPGAAIAVLQGGRFAHRKAYGLADLEWTIPLTPDCVFRIASLTKPFTAMAIMILAEHGSLSIDDPVERHLPWWPPRGRLVTLRHLLNHTSGVWRHDWDRQLRTTRPNITLADLLPLIGERDFEFEPGESYRYNNAGYLLLGAVVEAASGRRFEAFLREAIFEPLGMRRTGMLRFETVTRQRARGHVLGRSGFHNARPDGEIFSHAAGGLGSTLDDLALWDRALREHRLVSPETFERMLAPTPLSDGSAYPYGLGWGLTDDYLGLRLTHHAGGVSGFACQMLRARDEDLTLIVLSNLYAFPFDQVNRALLRIARTQPLDPPPLAEATPGEVAACVGAFIGPEGRLIELGPAMAWASLGRGCLCDPGDPEVEFRFSDLQGGRYQRLDYVSPLWPDVAYRRVANG